MLNLRLPLDPRQPETAHAGVFSSAPLAQDPRWTIAWVSGICARWESPLTQETIQLWKIRAKTSLILKSGLLLFGVAGMVSFLIFLASHLFASSFSLTLFLHREPQLIPFWLGTLALILLFSIDEREKATIRILPIRKPEESLRPLPDGQTQELCEREQKGNILAIDQSLTTDARLLIARAFEITRERRHGIVLPIHVFAAGIETREFAFLCKRLGIEKARILASIQTILTDTPVSASGSASCNQFLYALLLISFIECYRERRSSIRVMELLLACATLDRRIQEMLTALGTSHDEMRYIAEWLYLSEDETCKLRSLRSRSRSKPKSHMNHALTARPTPALDSLGVDYTQLARNGHFPHIVGRDRELEQVFRILQNRLGNILFVGNPGTGKSELLKGIANLMAAENVPAYLRDKRFVILDPGALVGGAEGVGGLESLFRRIMHEVSASGNIILGIEDLHHLIGASSTRSSEDVGHMLMNELSEGKLRVIATTTTDEFSQYIQPVPTFLRRFQVIRIDEMDFDGTIRILEARSAALETQYGVTASFPALRTCFELCDRYLSYQHFPDKALQSLEEGMALARERRGSGTTLIPDDIASAISRKANITVTGVTEDEADKLLRLEETMRERIIDQDEAVEAIASALRRSRTGLKSHARPVATFLFLGPTGVGKTETAKTIADISFGSQRSIVRIDMSEYQTPESMEKLLGKTGGSSPFLDTIRRSPSSLVLLDEFEKAHEDVVNLFLQVFDDGRLTDGNGGVVDFTHTMIIATSNAGSERIQQALRDGKSYEEIQRILMEEELEKSFRSELINRFDRVVIFKPLKPSSIVRIAKLMTAELVQSLEEKGIGLEISDEALSVFSERGFYPRFGARELRRVIQDAIADPIAKLLLQKEVKRCDTVVVRGDGDIFIKHTDTTSRS